MGWAAFAERIEIRATIGEKTSRFSIFHEKDDYILDYQTSSSEKRKIKIGKKNFNFVLSSVNEILDLTKDQKAKSSPCSRDLATVELVKDAKNKMKTNSCLMSGTPQAKRILQLLNVISMDLI